MKELDKNISYDLRDLNEKQFKKIQKQFKKQGEWNILNVSHKEMCSSVYFSKERKRWGRHIESDKIGLNALTLFEWQPKLGDKVLVPNCRKGYSEKIYIATYSGLHIVKDIVLNQFTQYAYIKPYEDEIKVGDWVKTSEVIFKVDEKDKDMIKNLDKNKHNKITNQQLIELLNNEL